MLNRDFTKSNKEYFKKNKNILIAVGVFLLVGILIFAIFGMNGNFEIAGYNEFSITINERIAKNYGTHQREIGEIVNSYGGKFDAVLIYGEGDNTQYIVRYMDDVDANDVIEINKLVAEKLNVEVESISNHINVGPVAQTSDYVYTIVSILIIITLATIFCYARYNGASAMSVLISNILGVLGFVSLSTILRLQVGMAYFAMLVILTMLITYFAISIFEAMHKSSWLISQNYSEAIENAVKSSKFRMSFVSVGLLLIGLLFVLIASSTIKYISLNLMFMAVVLLAVGLYVIPFVWSVFITRSRKREYKIKATEIETK